MQSVIQFPVIILGEVLPCTGNLSNIALYEGALNTLIYFPASPNGVKWTTLATTDELTEVDIVNYDDTVDPNYTADYAFNSSGLIIKNATTTAEAGHLLSTAGLYTAECGGQEVSFKLLVVRKYMPFDCLWRIVRNRMISFRYLSFPSFEIGLL